MEEKNTAIALIAASGCIRVLEKTTSMRTKRYDTNKTYGILRTMQKKQNNY